MYYIYIYIMDLQKYLNNMDHIDILLIIAVIVLLYVALSGNFEYYSASEEIGYIENHAPVNHPGHDKVSHDVKPEHLIKPLHMDKTLHQEQGEVLPCSGGDEPPCEYDNPNDVDIAPVDYDETIHDITEKQPFNPIGIMDHTDNMGINIHDMDRPLAAPGMDIYNASYGSVGRTPHQNIMNSMHEDQFQMDTLHLLHESQHDSGGHNNDHDDSLMNQDKNNGFFAHVGNELSHLGDDVTSGLGFGKKNLIEGQEKQNRATITMLRADWCGFCEKAKPEWDKIVQEFKDKTLLNYPVYFKDYEEGTNKEEIKKYKVDGFPTYVVEAIKDGIEQAPIQFNASPTYDAILKKIEETLGQL
jgi:thiol-disulfide isomerase/thioredoxin